MEPSSKARGDVAEYKVVAELLERGKTVLMPCGDRLPYDVAVDSSGKLLRLQVRRAWLCQGKFVVDVRRSQTNRLQWRHTKHGPDDYDFLIAWIPESTVFYVIPAAVASTFASNITLTDRINSRAAQFKNAWHLIDAGRGNGNPGGS
jgi:hypothetical protein